MQIDPAQFRALFFEEAVDHLAAMESGLVHLEERADDAELVNSIFRAAHSIKGASGSFGLTEIAAFTHRLENVLDDLRNGAITCTPDLIDVLLRAADVLRGLVASAQHGAPVPAARAGVEEELKAIQRMAAAETNARAPAAATAAPSAGPREVYVRFVPDPELFCRGGDPLLVLRDLETGATDFTATTSVSALPALADLDPERCYLRFDAAFRTTRTDRELADLFAFVEDGAEIVISGPATAAPEAAPESAPAAPAASKPTPIPAAAKEAATLRVTTHKVDKIINLVGELVIAQSMILDAMSRVSGPGAAALREAFSVMDRNTRELQDTVMSVRMMPLGSVFQRFPRLMRDLGAMLGKLVDLEVEGDDTELDKTVIEGIGDPLVHLLRNAVDHGLETPAERIAAGKPERGVVHISAAHRGGTVQITVRDDGRGLDAARIHAKAVERGLVDADADLTIDQIHELLFLPGFSTAATISDVSGRGVGMDVVKRNIEALGGSVGLSSTPGQGTTCTIRLPLTLAILEGLSLRVHDQCFIVPLVNVIESFSPKPEERKSLFGRGELVQVRGETLPLVRLARLFHLPEPPPTERCLITVVEHGARRVALVVDELLGQSQVVLKSLEANYQRVDGIGGATILGDGRVALVLDLQALVRSVSNSSGLRAA